MATPPPIIPTPPSPQPNPMSNAPGGAVPSVPLPPRMPSLPQPAGMMKPSDPKAAGPGTPPGAPPMEGEEEGGPQLSFWHQPWVQNVLPFVSSLAVHAGIIIIGLVLIAGYKAVEHAITATEEQIGPSDSALEENQPGGVQNVGLGGDPTRPAAQDEFENVTEKDGWADKPGDAKSPELTGGGDGEGSTDPTIGLGPGGGFGSGQGLGSGKGNGRGSGTGQGGPLAPFGAPGGGGIGPKSRFMGLGGNARTVAFVCDASGSMINTFSTLKGELTKAVTGLKAIQGFNIVFFSDEKFQTMDNNLVLATPESKRKAFQFLDDISTSGTTNPIPGIEQAFKNKPQLIYLLTDADFPDNAAVLATVRRLNASKQTKINTIIFTSGGADGEVTQTFVDLMKQIASENGGQYKLVKESDLSN